MSQNNVPWLLKMTVLKASQSLSLCAYSTPFTKLLIDSEIYHMIIIANIHVKRRAYQTEGIQ